MAKYATIMDIARELGLSKSTVSRALSGRGESVKEDTLRRILATADRMGYQRNEMAVNLRRQNTHLIGIVIPEIVTSFFMRFVCHAQQLLRREGYQVMVAIANESAEEERECLQMMERCRVDGILMSVCHKEKNVEQYLSVARRGIPIVFFDRTLERTDVSQVRMDDYIMSFFMVETLIRSGRKRILHLVGPDHIRNGYDRLRGYRDALEKFHIAYDPALVERGALSAEEGSAAMERVLKRGTEFDAVFAFTETSLLGAKTALQKHGCRIPADVALCCMSGTTLCTLVHPTITAVEQPVEQMASEACRLLTQKIAHPETQCEEIVLRGEMVEREST